MGYDFSSSAAGSAYAASETAKKNAELLETIDDTTDGTYILVESLHEGVRKLLDLTKENQSKLDALSAENKELRQKINSLENQLNKTTTYVR